MIQHNTKTKIILFVSILFIILYYLTIHNNILKKRIVNHIKDGDTIIATGCDKINLGVNNSVVKMDINNLSSIEESKDIIILNMNIKSVNVDKIDLFIERIKFLANKKIIVLDDTPNSKIDTYINNKININNFLTKKEWISKFENHNMTCVYDENISRWEFPFSSKTLLYPIPKSFMIFEMS